KNSAGEGGGVYCRHSDLQLVRCSVDNNGGGGISFWLPNQVQLTESSFPRNLGPGCNLWESQSSRFISCVMEENRGSGLFCDHSSPTLTDCTLASNSSEIGGGVHLESFSDPNFISCSIIQNSARQGGGFYTGFTCEPNLENCTISQNEAEQGGAFYLSRADGPVMRNCSILENSSIREGGAFYSESSEVRLNNCTVAGNRSLEGKASGLFFTGSHDQSFIINSILWNTGDEVAYQNGTAPVVTRSVVRGGFPGEGNLDTDPMFVDQTNHDYLLSLNSPCIDSGYEQRSYNDACIPPGQGTERNDLGYTGGFSNCDVINHPSFPGATTTHTPLPPCDSGYYVLDSYGGRHRVGNPTIITGGLYFGRDLARDLERADVRVGLNEEIDLVVLDGAGAAHFVEYPSHFVPQMFYFGDELNEFPEGRAVDLEMTADSLGLWVLTDYGGIYRAGSAQAQGEPVMVPHTDEFDLGWDVPVDSEIRAPGLSAPGGATLRAVSLVVIDEDSDNIADGYVILDSMGGHYQIDDQGEELPIGSSDRSPENSPQKLLDPGAYVWPFFEGLDIARDMELHPTQQGVVVFDGWGGIHPVPVDCTGNRVFFANNRDPENPEELITTVGMPYIVAGFPP
ncbi:MAG: right-handed parallel beta-helix repeat-containing protein, partial [Candidatus Omnitrophica bacterium]|nr:right-handed parallel beta-helix repeat-containing protein [Candidatus Omnitrophota bacterium]